MQNLYKARKINKVAFLIVVFIFIFVLFMAFAQAYDSSRVVNVQYTQPGFKQYYSKELYPGSGSQYQVYWPSISDIDRCEARQDFLVTISPAGCTPGVVRSDLLAEQNVPVFCQLSALKINPLIEVDAIKNIIFSDKEYSKEIAGVGFHPARAAIRTKTTLLGSPLLNDIGYAVIVLKKMPEKEMPEWVSGNLSILIRYDVDEAYGIGRHEFFIPVLSDEEWSFNYKQYSFWNGKGYLRLDWLENEKASISIYSNENNRLARVEVEKGKLSDEIYLPGFFCRAALQVKLDEINSAEVKARLQVDSDVVELVKGGKFLNSRCYIRDIKSYGIYGEVDIACPRDKFILKLNSNNVELEVSGNRDRYNIGKKINESYLVYAGELPEKVASGFFVVLGKEYNDVVKARINSILKSFERKGGKIEEFEDKFKAYGFSVLLKNEESEGIKFIDFIREDRTYTNELEVEFKEAIDSYEKVVEKYPGEKEENKEFYGDVALSEAEDLSKFMEKTETLARLYEKHIAVYPDSINGKNAEENLKKLEGISLEDSSFTTYVDNEPHNINLLEIISPKLEEASVKINYYDGTKSEELYLQKGDYIREESKDKPGFVRLVDFNEDEARIDYRCKKIVDGKEVYETPKTNEGKLKEGESLRFCDERIYIEKINLKKYARISLVPKAFNQESFANFSFKIGIEKRNIKLTPEKTEEMIANLEESIKKWEGVTNNLRKVVSGMKGACLATSAVLIAKNLVLGFSGEATARKEVMEIWREKCSELVAKGEYEGSMDKCYADAENARKIEDDIDRWKEVMNKENEYIKDMEKDITQKVFLGESVVDTRKSGERYFEYIKSIDSSVEVTKVDGTKEQLAVNEVLAGLGENPYENGKITYDEMKSIKMNDEIIKGDFSEEMKNSAKEDLGNILTSLKERNKQKQVANEIGSILGVKVVSYRDPTRKLVAMDVGDTTFNQVKEKITNKDDFFGKDKLEVSDEQHVEFIQDGANTIMNILTTSDGKNYHTVESYSVKKEDDKVRIIGEIVVPSIEYMRFDETTYRNKYLNPKVKYFGTDPYKDMPAIVPFDRQNGWYAAVKQTLPIFGNSRGYDLSGRVSTFWVCNVGKNGLEQFNEGMGDDICRQINLEAGQPLNVFPGLNTDKAREITGKALQAIEQAAEQYGKRKVRIFDDSFDVDVAVNVPEMECQNFMSPGDCSLLFNLCDPVICPSSRCNLGGQFYVSDVIQSGIIGGITLCLPNFGNPLEGGVAVPLCLSGIHAGLDSFTQILKAEKACLNESLATGNYVGICDQITSVYKCEFFWREIAPFLNNLIPRIIQWAYGLGTRGGGEYASVMDAWKNAENSISYMKDYYGKNSMKAFQLRSMEEAGTEICKNFVSLGYPKSFKTLIEPDSPPQFHAWFDEIPFTTATVPPTSQYKVFFNIYSGKDSGNYYSVYLKRSSEIAFYDTPTYYVVKTGFVGKENSVSESRDFTAPSGYQELCVRVGLQEECGFKQVSTSFALNYVRDKYIQEQATETDIKTEEECVSGTNSLYAFAMPSSVGGMAEQAIIPSLEDRGVVRICSSRNPGENVEEDRWQKVGYCNQEIVGCWLDKKSIDESITAGDAGVLNKTLSELKESEIEEQTRLNEEKAREQLKILEEDISSVSKASSEEINDMIKKAEEIENSAVFSYQKAKALLLKARIYDFLTRQVKEQEKKTEETIQPEKKVELTNKVDSPEKVMNIGDYYIKILSGKTVETAEITFKFYEGSPKEGEIKDDLIFVYTIGEKKIKEENKFFDTSKRIYNAYIGEGKILVKLQRDILLSTSI